MKTNIAKDQVLLESLVDKYGKFDVIKYVNKLNEATLQENFKDFVNDLLDNWIWDNYSYDELDWDDYNEIVEWLKTEEAIDFIIEQWELDNKKFKNIESLARKYADEYHVMEPDYLIRNGIVLP